jgi:hypothetical protein
MPTLIIPNIAEKPIATSAVTQGAYLYANHFKRMDAMYRYWYEHGQGVRGDFAAHPDVKDHSVLTNGERRALARAFGEWD